MVIPDYVTLECSVKNIIMKIHLWYLLLYTFLKRTTMSDWLIDWKEFYAVLAIFQTYNGGTMSDQLVTNE